MGLHREDHSEVVKGEDHSEVVKGEDHSEGERGGRGTGGHDGRGVIGDFLCCCMCMFYVFKCVLPHIQIRMHTHMDI